MVDIDDVGGVQVIVRELLEAGLLNGDVLRPVRVKPSHGRSSAWRKTPTVRNLSRRETLQADRRLARARGNLSPDSPRS
jgi:dihydroxyacid dehydratase/phosphogluconate dehydratase